MNSINLQEEYSKTEISKILLEILNVLLIVYFFLSMPLSTLKGIIMSEKNDEVSESYETVSYTHLTLPTILLV